MPTKRSIKSEIGSAKSKSNADDLNLDDWVQSVETSVGCHTCAHEKAARVIRGILESIARNKATHITLRQIHKKVKAVCPDYSIGYWGFRSHLYEHEQELYSRAKGKAAKG